MLRLLSDDDRPNLRLTCAGLTTFVVLLVLAAFAPLLVHAWAQSASPERRHPPERGASPEKGAATASGGNQKSDDRTDLYGDALPPGATSRLGTSRFRHPGMSQRPRFLPNSHKLIVNGDSGVVIFDAETGKLLRRIPALGTFESSPDGTRFATLSSRYRRETGEHDTTLSVWKTESGKKLLEIKWTGPTSWVGQHLAFSPDGKTIATGSDTGKLRFWDLASKTELLSYRVMQDRITSVAFSPDGQTVAVAGGDGVALWRWLAGDAPQKLDAGRNGAVAATFSPDGKWLATASDEQRGIRVWNVATKQVVWRIEKADKGRYSHGLAFTPDSRLLAVPRPGIGVVLLEADTGKLARNLDAERGAWIVAVSSDGQLVAGLENTLTVWRLPTGEVLSSKFVRHAGPPRELEFTPDGKRVVTGSWDATARCWDAASGKPLHEMRHDQREVAAIAVSPSGKWAATAGLDYAVRLWNLQTGRQRFKLHGHADFATLPTNAVRFSPDEGQLLSFGVDFYLRAWDVRTGMAIKEYEIRPSGLEYQRSEDGEIVRLGDTEVDSNSDAFLEVLSEAQFTHDGQYLLLNVKGAIHVFQTASGREVGMLKPDDFPHNFAVSADGNLLATVERRRLTDAGAAADPGGNRIKWFARVRNLATKKVLREIELPSAYGSKMAFSPDGKLLATTLHLRSADQKSKYRISIWDAVSGKEYARIDNSTNHVHGLAFSPDGQRLASSHHDTTVLIWDLEQFRLKN